MNKKERKSCLKLQEAEKLDVKVKKYTVKECKA